MTPFWWGFVAGLFIGCNVAVLVMGILVASRDRRPLEIGRDEIAQLNR